MDKVAAAICRISEAFSKSPTEETLLDAVEQHLTGTPDADEVIYAFARNTLLLLRTKQHTMVPTRKVQRIKH